MNQENIQQNSQHQPQDYYPKPHYQEDEIDIRELFSIIWKGKWLIIAITFIFAVGSVAYALWLPNEYKATALVQPNESGSGGKLASLAGQFGGLASLAGINLGAGESNDAVIAMEILKSWSFAEQFINKHDLAVPLFASEGWRQDTNELILNKDLYDVKQKKWLGRIAGKDSYGPSSWELFKVFKERVSVSQDKETGLVSIEVSHYSPQLAKNWTDWLIEDINLHMKERALNEANENIKYLEEQINQTSLAELRTVFSELMQEQYKTKMLAQVSDEYVFKTISKARVPAEKFRPKRAIIVLIALIFGGLLGVILVILNNIFKKSKVK